MTLIGITGGIGMGKSTCGDLLQSRALPVIDTDVIARDIVKPGEPALREIVEAFGSDMIDSRGELRRSELARKVFADAAARRQLEAILHPRIREAWRGKAQQWKNRGEKIGFVIIPLLFETDAASSFDAIICVACSAQSQRERLQQRGWSPEQIRQRIDSQMPVQRKIDRSDFVIWTETTNEQHGAQVDCLLPSLMTCDGLACR